MLHFFVEFSSDEFCQWYGRVGKYIVSNNHFVLDNPKEFVRQRIERHGVGSVISTASGSIVVCGPVTDEVKLNLTYARNPGEIRQALGVSVRNTIVVTHGATPRAYDFYTKVTPANLSPMFKVAA